MCICLILFLTLLQDASAAWGQQTDPSQWAAYYGYGYDAYAYGVAQDPSYAYGAYAGYGQYPQQARIKYYNLDAHLLSRTLLHPKYNILFLSLLSTLTIFVQSQLYRECHFGTHLIHTNYQKHQIELQ